MLTPDQNELVLALFTPGLMTLIYVLHAIWVVRHRGTNSQQEISLLDLNNLQEHKVAENAGLRMIEGTNVQYTASDRSTHDIDLPDDSIQMDAERNVWRVPHALTVDGDRVKCPLICDDELNVKGNSVFVGAVKVNGDMNIEAGAEVTFHEPVIVNGVFRLKGKAHFVKGILTKNDSLIEGTFAIGTRTRKGWAVMRQLSLKSEIQINGRIVTERAIAVKEDA